MYKYAGILRAVSQRTGCTVKICGDHFNVPVKYCDPYVFVFGDNKQNVDEAYLILTDAIKGKLNEGWSWKEHSQLREHSLKISQQRMGAHH